MRHLQSLVREAIDIVIGDLKHDVHAVAHFVKLVSQHIHEKNKTLTKLIQFTDGCAAQYKSKTALTVMFHFFHRLTIQGSGETLFWITSWEEPRLRWGGGNYKELCVTSSPS